MNHLYSTLCASALIGIALLSFHSGGKASTSSNLRTAPAVANESPARAEPDLPEVAIEDEARATVERPATSVTGLVQDGKGYPFSGTTVALYRGDLQLPESAERIDQAQSDADGVFEFMIEPDAGPHFVIAGGRGTNRISTACVPGETMLIIVERAEDPAFIEVVAVDTEGHPVTEYSVRLSTAGRSRQALEEEQNVFAADGHFQGVVHVLPGQETLVDVCVRARGYREVVVGPVAVRPDEEPAVFKARLEKAEIVWGTVVDPTGAPLADATVRAISTEGVPSADVRTDGTGRFELANGEVETLDMLLVEAPGFAAKRASQPPGGWNGVQVRLGSGGIIRGQVLGGSGSGQASVAVLAWIEHAKPEAESYPLPVWRSAVSTGSTGRFEIRDVPEGRVHVACFMQTEDRSMRFQHLEHTDVVTGRISHVEIDASSPRVIRGQVSLPEPVEDAVLWIDLHAAGAVADALPMSRTLVQSGRPFELHASGEGTYELRIHTSRSVYVSRRVECWSSEIDLGDLRLGLDAFFPGERVTDAQGSTAR